MFRYPVIDLAAANSMDMASLSGLPVIRNPGLIRQARMAQEDQVSYQYVDRDDSVHLGPVLRRRRQAPVQMADDFIRPSRFAEAARRRIQEEEDLDTAADVAYGAAVSFIT